MDGRRLFNRRVYPCLGNFKNEHVVPLSKVTIDDFAFDIRVALLDMWCFNAGCWFWRETESGELIWNVSHAVRAALNYFFKKGRGGDIEYALSAFL